MLVGVAAAMGLHTCRSVPRDVELVFVLSGLELRIGEERVDRRGLVELVAEIGQGGETRARSSFAFGDRGAPLRTAGVAVRLFPGAHDVLLRLVVQPRRSPRASLVLRRRFELGGDQERVLVEVSVVNEARRGGDRTR